MLVPVDRLRWSTLAGPIGEIAKLDWAGRDRANRIDIEFTRGWLVPLVLGKENAQGWMVEKVEWLFQPFGLVPYVPLIAALTLVTWRDLLSRRRK